MQEPAAAEQAKNPVFKVSDDDEKPQPGREPRESPDEEFRLRIRERHGDKIDGEYIVAQVRRHVGPFGMKEYLEVDAAKTTNSKVLTNPTGHYVKLAKDMVAAAKQQARRALARMPDVTTTSQQAPPAKKCSTCFATSEMYGHGIELVDGKEAPCPACNTPERFAADQAARAARRMAREEERRGAA